MTYFFFVLCFIQVFSQNVTFFYIIVMIYLNYKAFRCDFVFRCFESISKGESKMISFKRTVDKLGRLVIPKEIREQYGFGENTPVEITPVMKNMLTIKLINNSCLFCKNENDLVEFHDYHVCRNCIKQMKKRN